MSNVRFTQKILKLEILGIIVSIITGSLLHFTFELSGNSVIVAIFSATNESVFEHLKIAFYPILFYSIFEYMYLTYFTKFKKEIEDFWVSRAIALVVAPSSILILFYSYVAILGSHNLFLDILIFVLAIVLAFLSSYLLLTRRWLSMIDSRIGILIIVVMVSLFTIFTFYPPHFEVFRDSVSGKYGF